MSSSSIPAASAAAAATAVCRTPVSSSSPAPGTAQLCPSRRFSFPPQFKQKLVSSSKISSVDGVRGSVVMRAKLNEVVGGVSNDVATPVITKPEKEKNAEPEEEASLPGTEMSPEAIAEFMTQVSSLVKLVDSKDVVELQLKQPGCELVIRKKEAMPQPPAPAPVIMMPQHAQPSSMPSPYPAFPPVSPPAAQAAPSAPPASSPPPAATPPPPKSSHPPLKSPMTGTFYRSPSPGQPPYVKVGDKVTKGQILCIIEAMKLMNEIEADHAGTVIDIMVEDAKPVGLDQPIFLIEP